MIQAENLSMTYGATKALDDATFDVRSGEVLGLLGPNGAGKTTTLKILTTFIHPSSGRVVVDGIDAAKDPIAVRRKIGYLPETVPVYPDMLVSEYLEFVGRARGLRGARLAQRRDTVVEQCGLESAFRRPIGELSKGYRQRVGLAQALVHDPDILILDEPTSGLDPLQIITIRELVRSLAKQKTILFSTHVLQEIEAVSDRVMIINEGRIIAQGTRAELERRALGTDRTVIEVEAPVGDVVRELQRIEGVTFVKPMISHDPEVATVQVRHAFGDDAVRTRLTHALRWPVRKLAPERPTLEEVFIALVKETAGKATAAPALETPPSTPETTEGGPS